MKIVSGKTGSPHVTSHEFRQIIEGTIGQESYILKSGDNLEPELVSNNLLKIKSGMMSHHGNVSSVENYDEIELTNGTQGMKRIDLIVNRYTRNDETKIENNSWVCIVGTPDASTPTVPSYTAGNLQEGDLIDDCPVLQISYDGINVTEVKKLLSVAKNSSEMESEIAELNRNKPSYMNTVNLIYTLINTDVSGTETWTATQDCYCVAELCAAGNDYYNASIILDGIAVARNSNDQIIMVNFPVKQGQIIKKSYGKVTCKFYSML